MKALLDLGVALTATHALKGKGGCNAIAEDPPSDHHSAASQLTGSPIFDFMNKGTFAGMKTMGVEDL